ncbi:MAG TPA: PQQ-dependent sugar dehydrogenase [Candidatus Krumholzibacteria bacterium]|nr:PQQ-dependent sugar dehydrogenase [Candidatus Krumholzibacteria bacterium]
MKRILGLLLVCGVLACSDNSSGPGGGGATDSYTTANAFPKLTFSRPTDIKNAGDGSNRLFVTQQTGQILVFPDQSPDSVKTFLDISSEVNYESFSELGMLGVAFHPQYETNGYFFVMYTAGTPTARLERVSRFHVSADANVADPSSEKIMYEFADQFPNHNGGALAFGPDGYLYIGVGDEGGAGDTNNNAQDRSRIFGKILRIDVDQNVDTAPYYGIPAGNPYVGNSSGYREDIWAYGFRNPWRFSFDGGRLIVADVGQRHYEEIDIGQKGGNYGWDCREGLLAYDQNENASSPLCGAAGPFIDPIYVYAHVPGQAESITGGYVYHGPTPGIPTKYIYGDFDTGQIWALDLNTRQNTELVDTDQFITTFGVGENQELYVAGYFADGTPSALYRIVKKAPAQ